MQPYRQSSLDGLCGIFAVINATRFARKHMSLAEAQTAFIDSLRVLANTHDLTDLIVDGLSGADIAKVFKEVIDPGFPIQRFKPFHQRKYVPIDEFWQRVGDFVNASERHTAFIGFGNSEEGYREEWSHWSLVERVTPNTLILADSDGMKLLRRAQVNTEEDDGTTPHCIYPSFTIFISPR